MTRRIASLLFSIGIFFVLAGCATPEEQSGVSGSTTVPDTNPEAIRHAAQPAFARYGYSPGRGTATQSLVFQRPAAQFAERLLGTPPSSANLTVRLQLSPLPHGNDFRLHIQVIRMDIRRPGGPSTDTQSVRLWKNQFESILREIQANAAHAGPGR